MNNTIKTSVVLAALLASTSAYSSDSNTLRSERNSPVTELSFANITKESKLKIKDKKNHIFYKQTIKENGNWSKSFDFTSLPDGDYIIELENDVEIIITPIKVRAKTATVIKEKEYKIIKPSIVLRDNKVYVTKMSLDKKSTDIEILYDGATLAYSETFKDTTYINRVFDFTDSLEGQYLFVIESEGRTFSKYINIENRL